MSPFEKHFKTALVTEADDMTPPVDGADVPVPVADPADAEAWKTSLDSGTNPDDFATAPNPEFGAVNQNLQLVKGWVERIEAFKEFINGHEAKDSLNVQINNLDRSGSVFKGLVRSEENRIIRLAEDLAGLAEVFKAYMIGSGKKIRDMRER